VTQPSLGDYFPLDVDTIRTAYLKTKAARLAGEPLRVLNPEALATARK